MIAPGRYSPAALCFPVWLLSPQSWSSRLRLPPFLPQLNGLYRAESAITEAAALRRPPDRTLSLLPASCASHPPQLRPHYRRPPVERHDIRLRVRVRRSVCRVAACPQHIVAERLPQLVGRYARRTHRLRDVLHQLGLATVPSLIRSMFPQNQAVTLFLADRQEQGIQN